MCSRSSRAASVIYIYTCMYIRLLCSLKLQVSFAKEPYKRHYILEMDIYIYAAEALVPRVFRHETMGDKGRGTWRGEGDVEGETLWGEKYSSLQSLHVESGKMLEEKRGELRGETIHFVGPGVKSVLTQGPKTPLCQKCFGEQKTREEGKTPLASTRRESGRKRGREWEAKMHLL